MRKVVVIGGSGFIGSHVADHLSDAGYQVIVYDHTRGSRVGDSSRCYG